MSTAFVQNLPFPQYTSFSFLILGIMLVALIVIVAILRMDRENIRYYTERNGSSKATPSDWIIGGAFVLIGALIGAHLVIQSIVHAEYAVLIGDVRADAMSEDIMKTMACMLIVLFASAISWKPFRVCRVATGWWIISIIAFAVQCILCVIVRYAVLWG